MSLSMVSQNIDSFFGKTEQGNRHLLVELETFRPKSQALAHSLQIRPNILVELCLTKERGIAELRFYQHGHEIFNCGSATLAAAHYCKQRFTADKLVYKLKSRAGEFQITQKPAINGLSIKNSFRYQCKKLNKTCWQKMLVGHSQTHSPVSLQQVGSYKIIEFPRAADIAAMCPRFQLLAIFQGGGIIATAPAHRDLHADYVLRYFAPRYGNPEDAATGSANFILLPYWQKRLKKNWLSALQLSPQGGRFWGECRGNTLSLFGFTRSV